MIQDSAGRYFASFVIETESCALPPAELVTGIDLGLNHFAVLSDGCKINSPRFLRRAEKNLKRRQRDLSRKQKGSRNRDKARLKVARAHARVADARRDFHHQLSTALIRYNQAVAVEDLAVGGLARTRLAKSVHDAGWSGFVGMLEYKARLYGRTFIRIGRFEPTSRTCSACGAKDGPKPLHVREWTCPACGARLDRDINAAVNVARAAGLAVTACRAQVRPGAPSPAQRSEAGTLRGAVLCGTAGISRLQAGEEVKLRSAAPAGAGNVRWLVRQVATQEAVVPKSRVRKRTVYTPPPPKTAQRKVSASWVGPAIGACLIVGLAWIVTYYLAGGSIPGFSALGAWNLVVGFGFIIAAVVLATRWH